MNKERPGQGSFLDKKPDVYHDGRKLRTGDEMPRESLPPPPPPPEKTENDNSQEPESPSREELLLLTCDAINRRNKSPGDLPRWMLQPIYDAYGGEERVLSNKTENHRQATVILGKACMKCIPEIRDYCEFERDIDRFAGKVDSERNFYYSENREKLERRLTGPKSKEVKCDEVIKSS